MPVIKIKNDRLLELIGKQLTPEELDNVLFNLKSESQMIEEGKLEVEINSDRPDLFISEGIARAIKGLIGKEKGLFDPKVIPTDFQLRVNEKTTRPYIGIAIIENYPLDENTLEELIQFQEKLHITVGRKRRKMAIGIHDLDKIRGKKIEYQMVQLTEKMIPLEHDKEMTIREVIEKTPQGKEYGNISLANNSHPAIIVNGEIISLPPVINSEITRLEVGTKNLLIDVTGTDKYTVLKTLDIIASVLNEKKGSKIGRVRIKSFYLNGEIPLLKRDTIKLDKNYIQSTLGIKMTIDQISACIEKMRMQAVTNNEKEINVTIPEYRIDIIHPVDIVEDIAMAYGYSNIPLKKPDSILVPYKDKNGILANVINDLLVGLGFQEVYTHILIGEESDLFEDKERKIIKIKNPVAETMKYIRHSLLPSILMVLRESQGAPLPIKVFEEGEIGYIFGEKIKIERALGLAIMKDEVGYEEIQASIYSLLRSLGLKPGAMKTNVPYMISGRTSFILANDIRIGIAGEIHPSILNKLNIKYPIAAAELSLSRLFYILKK